tara:strand:+ start:5237 stop:5797 length:561 start_codon:yes stop_codon:yes gene_type:complete
MKPYVISFAAYSGTGKTTLIEAIIPLLESRGMTVAVIKHSHHDIDPDPPGKDSHRFRQAGSHRVLLATPDRDILVTERAGRGDGRLADSLTMLSSEPCDIVLVEGFRHDPIDKIEISRQQSGAPWLYKEDRYVVAIAADSLLKDLPEGVPLLSLNDAHAVTDFIQTLYTVFRAQYEEQSSRKRVLT